MIIEKVVMEHLRDDHIVAYPEEPQEQIKTYVTVEKTGGYSKNFIYTSTITLKIYDTSMYCAALLLENVKESMKRLNERGDICKVSLETNGNDTDTERKEYRYQAVYEIKHY